MASTISPTLNRHSLGDTDRLPEDAFPESRMNRAVLNEVNALHVQDILDAVLHAKELEKANGLGKADKKVHVAVGASLVSSERAIKAQRGNPHAPKLFGVIPQSGDSLFAIQRRVSLCETAGHIHGTPDAKPFQARDGSLWEERQSDEARRHGGTRVRRCDVGPSLFCVSKPKPRCKAIGADSDPFMGFGLAREIGALARREGAGRAPSVAAPPRPGLPHRPVRVMVKR